MLRTDGFVVSLARRGTADGHDTDEGARADREDQILAVDHVATDDHGTCSLPRHTIRERID
ncbi:hypothetical protein Ate02nite_40070 [Paractinoplanes tereljensis]|uniref:Uncharacterized protein n=1 Tax=Paractinoplanes tereljensis TaxID=571912 RepID=A0A919TUS8_9ACTN|nr:hypothetical protein Ate02nite_40070 [Actinoplanes tereljensis]